ncbi:hypothetical protein DLAC_10150 [Tieghemostelium lacteum]|uniref:Uncharacterized protein n=1 Tax=Tieghemostelium lacteum TaxID=361077 RepID=A0A151Z689_TIELA|nr:hypothetical protein DLAC_10150 [Tieghemostelium lacteum]|eukprot:KYQ89476.1 hypothetical protein DLAC_10150 [Tieghemostelium lacteum]
MKSGALQNIIEILKNVHQKLENNEYKHTIDLFQPYVDTELFNEIKEQYLQKQNTIRYNNKFSYNHNQVETLLKDINENELDQVIDDQEDFDSNEQEEQESLYNRFQPFILQSQEVAAKFVKMASKGAAASSLGQISTPGSGHKEHGSGERSKKKRSKSGSAFPVNWNLIVSMASNLTLDQVKSMVGLLLMVLNRTPISVILKELHRYRMFASIIFDLFGAIYKRESKEIATQIIIATLAVISFMNRHDKFLSTVLSVSKYIHSTGAKKRFLFVRLLTLGLFLTNLFKIVNPPPITPLDLVQIVKGQLSSKL